MTDEFVTRAMYTAMVAERDALAARLAAPADPAGDAAREANIRQMYPGYERPDRFEPMVCFILRRLDAARASLAAAHGLQARAERAEAALADAQRAIRALCAELKADPGNEHSDDAVEPGCPICDAMTTAAALAAVPS